jgi:hypothetical protein
MKYFLPSILIFSIFTLLLTPVYAQQRERPIVEIEEEIRNENRSGELKEELAHERAEFRKNIQKSLKTIRAHSEERRKNSRASVRQEVQQRIEFSLEQTITQFENAIYQLSNIAGRLENRLIQMHEQGFDVALSFEALDDARGEIALSAEAIGGISRSIGEALSSDTPWSARATLRVSLEEARTSLKNARVALLRAIAIGRPSVTTVETVGEQEGGTE